MGKKTEIFKEGEFVFAKVKGYSPWPAKITKVIAKHRYGVYFYGTGETATVKSEDLDHYNEKNIGRFNTERQLKKSEYKQAVDQIEMDRARSGSDPAPTVTESKDEKTEPDLTTDSITDNSGDESQLHIAEEPPKPTPQAQKRKLPTIKPTTKVKEIQELSTPEPETKENDEKVSRSGRKIKEKKMNTDEMDPDEMFSQVRKRSKHDDSKHKQIPASDQTIIDDFRASKLHILQDPVKKNLLDAQYQMIHIMQDIKMALGLEDADVDKSIELLESFKETVLPHMTKLMLLKYPNNVDTVKRLRKYIGNLTSWDMEEAQVKQFHEKAEKIRVLSAEIYDKFKHLFEFPDDLSFWSKFSEEQKNFNEKYNMLRAEDLFEGSTTEELDSFVEIFKKVDENTTSTDNASLTDEDKGKIADDETSQLEVKPIM